MPVVPGLSDSAREVIENYRTSEFLTIAKSGVPIAWPTNAVFRPESGSLVLSTSIAWPHKAYNVRRDGRVAMLFSDPTGSGLVNGSASQVLVQGTAICTKQLSIAPGPDADLWRRIFAIQPSAQKYPFNPLIRRVMDIYFMRLIITVTPDAVTVRPPIATRTKIGTDRHGDGIFGDVARELSAYETSVLSAFDSGRRPTMTRVSLRPIAGTEGFAVELPDGFDVTSGPASLLSHSHNDELSDLRGFGSGGTLAVDDGAPVFTPATLTRAGDTSSLRSSVRSLRAMRGNARRYLEHRSLERPAIDWDAYRDLVTEVRG